MTEITDAAGAIVEKYEYDVFGRVSLYDGQGISIAESAIGNPYFFTGRRYDKEIGLYYYRARYYSPELGRFLSHDPLGYADGMNLYMYCHNGPVNFVDPSGLLTIHYWKPSGKGKDGKWHGHVSMHLADGTYISWWPEEPLEQALDKKKARPANYRDDFYGEGARPPDANIPIHNLDEDKIKEWWEEYSSDEDNWFSAFNNCSDIISEALQQGGAEIPNHLIYDPNKIKKDVEKWNELSKKRREEIQEYVESHPWKFEGDERFGHYERVFTGDPNFPGWRQRDKWEDVWVWKWKKGNGE